MMDRFKMGLILAAVHGKPGRNTGGLAQRTCTESAGTWQPQADACMAHTLSTMQHSQLLAAGCPEPGAEASSQGSSPQR